MTHWREKPQQITPARPPLGPHKTQKCVTNCPHKTLHGPLVSVGWRFGDIILLLAMTVFWAIVFVILSVPHRLARRAADGSVGPHGHPEQHHGHRCGPDRHAATAGRGLRSMHDGVLAPLHRADPAPRLEVPINEAD